MDPPLWTQMANKYIKEAQYRSGQRNVDENSNEESYTGQKGHYQKNSTNKTFRRGWEERTLSHRWWKCQLIWPQQRTVWRLKKTRKKKKTTIHPTNPTTEYTPEKPVIQKNSNSRVHCTISVQWIVTILAIESASYDRICNRPRYLSTDEWIKKLWYIYWMEYYSAIKRNKFESVLDRCMNLEPLIQSKVGQKNKYRILTHMYEIQKNGTNEPICRVGIETLR